MAQSLIQEHQPTPQLFLSVKKPFKLNQTINKTKSQQIGCPNVSGII
jgi:hypothetical protein